MKNIVVNITNFSSSIDNRNGSAIFCSTGRINGSSIEGSKLLIM